jgi:hypothetical protein
MMREGGLEPPRLAARDPKFLPVQAREMPRGPLLATIKAFSSIRLNREKPVPTNIDQHNRHSSATAKRAAHAALPRRYVAEDFALLVVRPAHLYILPQRLSLAPLHGKGTYCDRPRAARCPFTAPGDTRRASRSVFRERRCVALSAGPKVRRVESSAPHVAVR